MTQQNDPLLGVPVGLSRDAEHFYFWRANENVPAIKAPGVTGTIKVLDKSGPLIGWAKKVTATSALKYLDTIAEMKRTGGEEAAIRWLTGLSDYERDKSADLGTRVHVLAEQIGRGENPVVSEDEGPFVGAYLRDFIGRYEPKFLAMEAMVFSLKHGYGGTLDAICEIAGETWLVDYKTGKGVYQEVSLQLAALAFADFIGRPGEAKKYRLPKIDRYGVVHVRPEGARLVEFRITKATFAAFLNCRQLSDWRNTEAKTVISNDPIQGVAAA